MRIRSETRQVGPVFNWTSQDHYPYFPTVPVQTTILCCPTNSLPIPPQTVEAIPQDPGRPGIVRGRDEIVQGRGGIVRGRDGIVRGRDEIDQGREEIVQGRDGIVRGREEIVQGRDGIVQGRDGLAPGRDHLAPGRDGSDPGRNGSAHARTKMDNPFSINNLCRAGFQPAQSRLLSLFPNRPSQGRDHLRNE